MSINGQQNTPSEPLRKKIEKYSYATHDKLGSGYSSEVYRGRDDRSGQAVAVKVVNLLRVRQKGVEELLNREMRLLRELSHEHVIACREVLMTTNNCYIITEYCPQGDLAALLTQKGRMPNEEALPLLLGIVQGLAYLHAQGVMHRDIKPQNILLMGKHPKIADFGFACRSQLPRREAYTIGSPLYMSPQALTKREYSAKNDMWALGVTMFELLEGRPPWQANSEKDLREVIKAEPKFRTVKCLQLQEIIRGCLRHDPSVRLAANDVLTQLEGVMGGATSVTGSIMGVRSVAGCLQQDKQNNQRGNSLAQDDQVKKAMRTNYNLLKWLINYSRFAAKLLPKLQQHLQCEQTLRQPFIQLTARLLHLTISKLNRVEEIHEQLSLSHFGHFKRTTRFAKIQAVTAEYHQRYLLLLTRLPYKYHLPNALTVDLPPAFLDSLLQLPISLDNTQEHLTAIDSLITLTHIARQARGTAPHGIMQLVDFQKLVEAGPTLYCGNKVEELLSRRAKVAQSFTQAHCSQ